MRIDSDGRSCGLDAILWCPDKAASSFRPQLDLGLEYDDVSTTTEEAGVREEEDDEDVGLSASIGTEITPAAGGLWSMISAGYHWYDNSDWLSVQGNAGYWCTDRLLLSTGVQYGFDVEDVAEPGAFLQTLTGTSACAGNRLHRVLRAGNGPMPFHRTWRHHLLRRNALIRFVASAIVLGAPPGRGAAPLAREIIALYDSPAPAGSVGPEYQARGIQRVVEMPLNHLGLILRYHNLRDGLPPPDALAGVRGALVWFDQARCPVNPEDLLAWCEGMVAAGRKLVVIGDLPLEVGPDRPAPAKDRLARFWHVLGLEWADNSVDITYDVEVLRKSPAMVEFERPLPPDLPPFAITGVADAGVSSYLRLRKRGCPGTESDLVVTGPRGGYIAANYLGYQDQDGTFLQLYVNLFDFFRESFATDDLPKPDVTTLAGGRIYYSHIDGDGWRSETSVPVYKDRNASSAEVIYREAILPYPDLPVTVGPIVGDIDPNWHGNRSEVQLARDLFALPQVEAGTHTYTHPLDWAFFCGK
ncbi:MAG: hypothetical protein U1G05_14095, partial [Kiritimatiellia bacterium]